MNRLWTLALTAMLLICLTGARVRAADGDDTGVTAADTSDTAADTGDAAVDTSGGDTTAGPDAVTAPVSADGTPAGVAAEPSTRLGDQDLITMNFQNVDIPVLAKFISEITGRNFVLDESVRGKVSIISPTKVTPSQAYSIFQSVLQLKGFTTVTAGSVIKIVPARDVRTTAPLTPSQVPGDTEGDQYVTRMVRLENADAGSVMSVIQPMISHDGLIAAFPQDNTLIITDDAFNVQRLLRIIGSLDVQSMRHNVAVIPLKLAYADDLSAQIEKIMTARENSEHGGTGNFIRPGVGVVAPSAQGGSTNFSVVPDERTNSLIVLASPIEMREIKDLVEKMDIRSPTQNGRLHVYHLKYAPASEMVQVLDGLLGGSGGPSTLSPQTGKNSLGRGSSLGSMGGSSFGTGFGGLGSSSGGYGGGSGGGFGGGSSFGGGGFGSSSGGGMGAMGGMGGSRGANSNANSGPMTASTGGNKSADFTNAVSITADPATNSLVVSAAPQDYETLQTVIDQLDIPRVQVFVQAIIVEVSVQRTKDIGVNFQAATGISNSTFGLGQLNFGNLQNAIGNPLGLTGLGLGLASGSRCNIPVSTTGATTTTTASTVSAPCDVALMTALQSDTHSNVLSAPTLLTADNEEAMIVVGQNLPFVGSSAANSGLPGQIFNSVDRQNVGITLDIVPQVSQGEYVKLDLYEEVSNVVNGTQNNTLGPTTTIRSASTTVLVQNHRTAVIGGLLSSQTDNGRQGVPFLSDIPVLGNLFSDNNRDAQKQNLLIFLTPHIVRTRDDLQALALDERQKFVRHLGRTEVNNMPSGQFEQMYQPSFNRAVSPQQDLQQYQPPSGPASGGYAPLSSAPGPSFTAPPSSYSGPAAVYPGATASYPPIGAAPAIGSPLPPVGSSAAH
jgi:general secretion pathway protein D